MEPEKLTGYFDMDVHALQLVHSPACSAMFKRGLVSPVNAETTVGLSSDKEVEILARTLSPRSLNFSGLGRDIDESLVRRTSLATNGLSVGGGSGTSYSFVKEPNYYAVRQIRLDMQWDRREKNAGYFTVNAPEVKVFTGFIREREFKFGDVTMKPGKTALDYATISLLSLDDGGYLLAATSTMHNTDGVPKRREPVNPWQPNDMVTLENRWGDAPVLCEGVPLELTLPAGVWLVYPLDEAGSRRAGEPLRFENVPIRVGPEHKTLWYEIRPGR